MRSWPALYFLSYPSQHLLLDSRPREATSTVLRQNRTQASPSASHSNFSKAFWKPSISSNFEHIFSQNYLRMIAFPTLNLKCFKHCTRALMLFGGFCLLGFCFVACLRAPLLLHTTEHHCPWAQIPTKGPKETSHFHSSQSFMVLFLVSSSLLHLSVCTQELPTSTPLPDDSMPFLFSQLCHHNWGVSAWALQHELKLILFIICNYPNSVHNSTK